MGIIYDALTIAKWIINKIHPEPLKLQKLLYLAQGYSYAFYDRPLFKDDLEGWVHGPVVRNVYDIFKNYQYNSIDTNFEVEELDDEAKDIINYVIKIIYFKIKFLGIRLFFKSRFKYFRKFSSENSGFLSITIVFFSFGSMSFIHKLGN